MNELIEYSKQVERHRKEGWKNLDPEYVTFALCFVNTSSYVSASDAAGISRPRGKDLLSNPVVRALIADLQKEAHETNIVTEELIRTKLLELLPKLMGEEEIPIVLSNGAMVMERKFFPGEARAALESLGKSIGLGVNEGIKVAPVQVNINLDNLVAQPTVTVDGKDSD